jgi:hypothetical protein
VLARSAVVLCLTGAVLTLAAYPFDDAFIHLRLARNLAFSGQPYFNLGEPVMSGSSPLWLLWLAAGFRALRVASVGVAVATACLVIAALFLVCEGFLAQGGRRSRHTIAGALAVTVLALPSAGGLMETPLAVVFLVASLWALRSERLLLTGCLLGLAAATRFEMAVPAVGAVIVAPGWRGRWRVVAGATPVALGLAVWLQASFGTVIPHTMAAKAIVYQMRRVDLLGMGPQELGHESGAILALVLALATSVRLARMVRGKAGLSDLPERAALLAGVFPLVLLAIYVWRAPLVFPWYWPLSLCPMALFTLAPLTNDVGQPRRARMDPDRAIAITAVAGLACASLVGVGAAATGRLARSPWVNENSRTRSYLRVGAALARQCPSSVVAAPEIGALGWTFPGKILDGGGLASPEVLRFHPLRVPEERASGGVGAIPGRAVAAFRPDLLVSMEVFASDFTRKAATLPELSDYALWWQEPVLAGSLPPGLPSTLWGSRWIQVYSRHRSRQEMGCSA